MAPPKSLRDQVGRFLQSLRFEDTVEPPSGGVVWSTPTRLIVLDAKEREAFEKTCSLIRDYYGPDGQWSLDAVESHLRDAVFAATDEDAAADKVRQKAILDQLFEAMSRPIVRWAVYFPVIGINEECLPLEIGRAAFHASSERLSALVVKPDDAPNDDIPEQLRPKVRYYARKHIDERFSDSMWARVYVDAADRDSEAARDLGLEELRLTLDVLNFYADIWRPSDYRSRAALACEPDHSLLYVVAAPVDGEATGVTSQERKPLDDVWVAPMDSEDAQELALDRVSEILAKTHSQRTEIDNRLLAALRWAGRATVSRRSDEAFLLFMMALEALIMGPQKGEPIVYRLPLRVAQVLPEGTDRGLVKQHLKKLYDLRSKLVHTGWADITASDVESARSLTKMLTVGLLRNATFATMKTNRELDEWFEARILGTNWE